MQKSKIVRRRHTKNKVEHGFRSRLLYKNWRIRNKILAGFVLILLTLICITYISFDFITDITERYVPIIESRSAIGTLVKGMDVTEREFLLVDRTNADFSRRRMN